MGRGGEKGEEGRGLQVGVGLLQGAACSKPTRAEGLDPDCSRPAPESPPV